MPLAVGVDGARVLHKQQPRKSSILTKPPSTVPPASPQVTLIASDVEKVNTVFGAGEVTHSAPPERDSTGVFATTAASARDAHRIV